MLQPDGGGGGAQSYYEKYRRQKGVTPAMLQSERLLTDRGAYLSFLEVPSIGVARTFTLETASARGASDGASRRRARDGRDVALSRQERSPTGGMFASRTNSICYFTIASQSAHRDPTRCAAASASLPPSLLLPTPRARCNLSACRPRACKCRASTGGSRRSRRKRSHTRRRSTM